METMLKGHDIIITEVSANFALTVVYVFWDLYKSTKTLDPKTTDQKLLNQNKILETVKNDIQKNLTNVIEN